MKTYSTGKLRAALGPILGAGALLFAVMPVKAQTAQTSSDSTVSTSDQKVVKLEKVIVTGSNIMTAADALATPVSVITSQQIEASGTTTNMLDILRRSSPAISGIGTENATIATASTYGGAEVKLHGLPTLVLLNGRRVASSPAESVGGDRFVDLNMIPTAAIDHIDVLSDGASAIYGSDAVGGVINIVLKKNFNAWEIGSHYGYSPDKGRYSERSAYLLGGVSTDKTSITIAADYTKHDPIMFSQRPYTSPYYASVNYAGIVDVYNNTTGADEFYKLNPGYNAPPGGGTYTMPQLVSMGYYTDLGNASDPVTGGQTIANVESGFDLANYQTLISSLERKSALVDFEHNIFGDNLKIFGDILYSSTYSQSSLNAQPIYPYVNNSGAGDGYLDLVYIGETPPPFGTQYTPASASGNPFSLAWMEQASNPGQLAANTNQQNDYLAGNVNTGGPAYAVTAHNRFVNFPRLFQNDSTLFRATGGLSGKIGENYSWEAGLNLNRYELNYRNQNLLDATAFYAALTAGTINPFAINQAPGILPGSIIGTAFVNMISTLNSGDFVFRGTPFDLPGGPVSFAVGASYTRETLSANPDLNSADSGWLDSPTILQFDDSRHYTAVYGEVLVPIFGADQQIPALHALNVDAAIRSEQYETVGRSTVPKVALKWQPVDDQLSFRFSAGKAFVAPTLYELYGPATSGSSSSINYTPYGSSSEIKDVQFQATGGSNPNLQPSTATTWSAGLVYTPKQLKNLSFSFDYFQTLQKGAVNIIDEQTMVQSVETLGAASPYANMVHFGTATGPSPTAPGQISSHPTSAVWLVDNDVNIGATAIKGIDLSAEYKLATRQLGKFDLTTSATIYNSYMYQELPSQPYYQYAGHASVNENTVPRFRTFTTLEWMYKGFDFEVAQTYIPSVTDIGSGGATADAPTKVSSYQQYDFTLAYDFSALGWNQALDGLTVRIGIDNAFDSMPPLAPGAFPDTFADVGTYGGAIGRMLFCDLSYKF